MKIQRVQLVRRLARRSGVSAGEAADQLDRVVQQIVASVRKGRPVSLPGLGRFTTAPDGSLRFDQETKPRRRGDGE